MPAATRRTTPIRLALLLAVIVGAATGAARAGEKSGESPDSSGLTHIGDMRSITTDKQDTLVHLARDNNLGFVEIRAANPDIDPWLPGKGASVTLPTRHILPDAPQEGIVINLSEMRLYHFRGEDRKPASYPIGIGRQGLSTPTGKTRIVSKTARPEWRPTPRMREKDPALPEIVPPGPENPLGTHALYLGWDAYLLHGTNQPYGIGRRVSSGCIRLYPDDIITLYRNTETGTPVHVVKQAVKLAWIDDTLYLEAHTPHDKAMQMEKSGALATYELSDSNMQRILKVAGEAKAKLDWPTIRRAVRKRRGYPVAIAQRDQEGNQEGNRDGDRDTAAMSDTAPDETDGDSHQAKAKSLKSSYNE
jgi:L,D-transpeptidase ErfK/SrfK